MSIQTGLSAEVIPLSRLHGAAVVCLVGIGKPEASPAAFGVPMLTCWGSAVNVNDSREATLLRVVCNLVSCSASGNC